MWLNTDVYTLPQLILFMVAAAFWVVAYILIIKGIKKYQYVGIPVAAVCANFAWELLWSTAFRTNMGLLFEWGYRIWFFLDVYILIHLFRYGYKQAANKVIAQKTPQFLVLGLLMWIVGIYVFTNEVYDPIGAKSAYAVNTNMSAIYIFLSLRQPNQETLTPLIAWLKMLGTALTTVFCFWVFPKETTMLYLGVVSFILDMIYIYLTYKRPKSSTT